MICSMNRRSYSYQVCVNVVLHTLVLLSLELSIQYQFSTENHLCFICRRHQPYSPLELKVSSYMFFNNVNFSQLRTKSWLLSTILIYFAEVVQKISGVSVLKVTPFIVWSHRLHSEIRQWCFTLRTTERKTRKREVCFSYIYCLLFVFSCITY